LYLVYQWVNRYFFVLKQFRYIFKTIRVEVVCIYSYIHRCPVSWHVTVSVSK